jgi:hypothetical protein
MMFCAVQSLQLKVRTVDKRTKAHIPVCDIVLMQEFYALGR